MKSQFHRALGGQFKDSEGNLLKKSIITAAMALTLFGGATFTTLTEPINVSAKKVKKSYGLKRYKTGIPRKLPAGVPYPTSPKIAPVMRGMYIGNTGNTTHGRAAKVMPKVINWLKASGSKSSGSKYDSRGYLVPGKGQKVYRVTDPGNYGYTYYSTLSNGHHMIGQTDYRTYNVEVMPGTHKIVDGFTNPSNGKNWVLYYVSDYKFANNLYSTPNPKGFKSYDDIDLQIANHMPASYWSNPFSGSGTSRVNWKQKIIVVSIKAAEQSVSSAR